MIPRALAGVFGRVLCVEPAVNIIGMPANVRVHIAALSDFNGECAIKLDHNVGYHYAAKGSGVPCWTIDHFGLAELDLLMLDVEGAELRALRGAQGTIARTRPVIATIVARAPARRAVYRPADMHRFMESIKYKEIAAIERYRVYA